MKIIIVTQPLRANYGGLLQAFALQKICKNLGHDASTDLYGRTHPSTLVQFFKVQFIYSNAFIGIRKLISKFIPSKRKELLYSIQLKETNRFIDKNISTCKLFNSFNKINRKLLSTCDAIIVGSDQVWRTACSHLPSYFLNFTSDTTIKRIAYSASFGIDNWSQFNPELTDECEMLAQRFTAISVREDSGLDLCKKHLHVDATHTLDPTMLLNKDDYLKVIEDSDSSTHDKSMMTYVLDNSPEKHKLIDYLANKLKLTPIQVMPQEQLSSSTRNYDACVSPPVSDWLRGFRDAEFVLTDSFHGTVFAIIFNIPFLSIVNKSRGAARFESLLKLFHLENRLIESIEDITDAHLKPIDFAPVNAAWNEQKEHSLRYLKDALDKPKS